MFTRSVPFHHTFTHTHKHHELRASNLSVSQITFWNGGALSKPHTQIRKMKNDTKLIRRYRIANVHPDNNFEHLLMSAHKGQHICLRSSDDFFSCSMRGRKPDTTTIEICLPINYKTPKHALCTRTNVLIYRRAHAPHIRLLLTRGVCIDACSHCRTLTRPPRPRARATAPTRRPAACAPSPRSAPQSPRTP